MNFAIVSTIPKVNIEERWRKRRSIQCLPQIQICKVPFGWNRRSRWNCLWWAVDQSLQTMMTMSHRSIRSCFRCWVDVVNVIWPAVRFQWQHVSPANDDSTEMLCSLNCCLHLRFPPQSYLSHSNRIPWTITVVHGCSILPFLEWSSSPANLIVFCCVVLSFVLFCYFVDGFICLCFSIYLSFTSVSHFFVCRVVVAVFNPFYGYSTFPLHLLPPLAFVHTKSTHFYHIVRWFIALLA